MPSQPELPRPAHLDHDSMLSQKFGKEVTNYFGSRRLHTFWRTSTNESLSGSPLNRLSFLRGDYAFLKQAFDHGTTQFMIFRNLSPLVKTPSEIAYTRYTDIKSLIPNNPYDKTEEELIKEFNSSIFLGIDESRGNGLQYKNFLGAPQFAVDITPKGRCEEETKSVIAELENRGLTFLEGMRAMNFPAETGI